MILHSEDLYDFIKSDFEIPIQQFARLKFILYNQFVPELLKLLQEMAVYRFRLFS